MQNLVTPKLVQGTQKNGPPGPLPWSHWGTTFVAKFVAKNGPSSQTTQDMDGPPFLRIVYAVTTGGVAHAAIAGPNESEMSATSMPRRE